jgi:fructose-bisphosphate aldolase class I
VSKFDDQLKKMETATGFIAALDQSGGSTPKALGMYGVTDQAWSSEEEMYSVVHQMRTRIMTSPAFSGERILAAILFENTMDREVQGRSTAEYLWEVKNVAPILKVDKGLADEDNGVQLMKPMPQLDDLLDKAKTKGIFGTKMRSVIKKASADGVVAVVKQQFDLGKRIVAAGLVPIIEPEVDINCADKAEAEKLLRVALLDELNQLTPAQRVIFKLTLPEQDDFYIDCIEHPNIVRVVALSGGYSREESNARLARNHNMVASFSRALTEGLSVGQTDDEFNALLDTSIQSIVDASAT